MARRSACGTVQPLMLPRCWYICSMSAAVLPSSTLHRDTTAAAAPANRKPRARPTTPSALISPRPVLQALSTTVAPSPSRTPSRLSAASSLPCTSSIERSGCAWSGSRSFCGTASTSESVSMSPWRARCAQPAPFKDVFTFALVALGYESDMKKCSDLTNTFALLRMSWTPWASCWAHGRERNPDRMGRGLPTSTMCPGHRALPFAAETAACCATRSDGATRRTWRSIRKRPCASMSAAHGTSNSSLCGTISTSSAPVRCSSTGATSAA